MVPSLRKFSADEVAQERLKIIQFYEEHGEAQTIKYFGGNRKTLWTWKRHLQRAGGQLQALCPHSTRPQHTRRMTTDSRLVLFIRELREKHPHLGKEKIKPLLDAPSRKLGIASLAVSTIGKVICRYHLFPKPGKVYHDPNSGWAKNKSDKRAPRHRVRYAPKPAERLPATRYGGARARWTQGLCLFGCGCQRQIRFLITLSRKDEREHGRFLDQIPSGLSLGYSAGADG